MRRLWGIAVRCSSAAYSHAVHILMLYDVRGRCAGVQSFRLVGRGCKPLYLNAPPPTPPEERGETQTVAP